MKLSKNFSLKEFVDADTYKHFGDKSIWFVDERVVRINQKLRERLDLALYINTWWMVDLKPGDPLYFNWSGFRTPQCKEGTKLSQHRLSRASDTKVLWDATLSPAEGAELIRDELKTNFHIYKELGLTTIESAEFAPTWCHLDCRWSQLDSLLIVAP
jgi:hypothetical protein